MMKPKLTVEDLFETTKLDITTEDYEALMNELESDYDKARAFDKLLATYESHKNDHTHDLKSALGTKAIEIMEEIRR